MKKIVIIAVVLVVGVWAMSMRGHCELESEKTHEVAKPIVKALATYAKEHGIPNLESFEQIEGIPYSLKPCSERPDLEECKGVYQGYYFQLQDNYYCIAMAGSPTKEKPKGFFLSITHNYTVCTVLIYKNGQVLDTKNNFSCSLDGRCSGWFRQ